MTLGDYITEDIPLRVRQNQRNKQRRANAKLIETYKTDIIAKTVGKDRAVCSSSDVDSSQQSYQPENFKPECQNT